MTVGPLDGITVVDLGRALAAPHAGMMLGDMGARVIKVEPPHGDDSRYWGPPFLAPEDGGDTETTYFFAANRNKESIVLDVHDDVDRGVLRGLVARADVLIENFRPGTMDRLGFGIEVLRGLNPRLVVLSISGFGHDGPERDRAGYDQIAQGEAGLMSLTGPDADHPQKVGVPIADLLAGLHGLSGVLAALVERDRTGRGSVVRTSLIAAVVGVHSFQGTAWTVGQHVGRAQGNHHPSISPYGLFRCANGAVQIACGNNTLWKRLCAEFDIDADPDTMGDNASRVAHTEDLRELLERTFADLDEEALLRRLSDAGVPAGRVRSLDEVYAWEQVRSQGLLIEVDHPTIGPMTLPGPPVRFFDHDEVERTRVDHTAPPTLGQHDQLIRAFATNGPPSPKGWA